MSKYLVSFIKTIEIEAEDMDEAVTLAQNQINFRYDEIEVEEDEYDDGEDEDDCTQNNPLCLL
jgi:hypothetical protein